MIFFMCELFVPVSHQRKTQAYSLHTAAGRCDNASEQGLTNCNSNNDGQDKEHKEHSEKDLRYSRGSLGNPGKAQRTSGQRNGKKDERPPKHSKLAEPVKLGQSLLNHTLTGISDSRPCCEFNKLRLDLFPE
jgi:hypothetical protein